MNTAATGDLVSIPHLLERNAKLKGNLPAYREKEFGIWQSWTWSEASLEIENFALGLMDLGVKKGDFVAIIGRNRPSMYWGMVAVQMLNAVPVPLYQDSVAEEMAYVLEHCGAKFVIVGDQEQVDKIIEVQENVSGIERIIYFDPKGLRKYDHNALSSFADIQKKGVDLRKSHESELDKIRSSITLDDICVMLYTSGTTGRPKGVVLSNRNIIETSKNSSEFDNLKSGEETVAYLPMAWVGDNIKIITFIQDLDTYEVYQSEIANVARDLDPDVDGDGITNNDDNCPSVHNFTQEDWDEDGIGDACDYCNDVANVPGNVNIDASGQEVEPIINVMDILAFSDLLDDNSLINDCQSLDLLEDTWSVAPQPPRITLKNERFIPLHII